MTTISTKQRTEWKNEIINDHPEIPKYMIDIMLDIYQKEAGYFDTKMKEIKKQERKKNKKKLIESEEKAPIQSEFFTVEIEELGDIHSKDNENTLPRVGGKSHDDDIVVKFD
jgi:hypothetical protein